MKVYVTDRALTTGILEQEVSVPDERGWCRTSGSHRIIYKFGKECFEFLEEAREDAEKRRMREMSRLHKRMIKIGAMKF